MKRAAALLMILTMLLTLAPGALADTLGGRKIGAAHTHKWVLQDVDYTGCTSTAYYVYTCECGESKVEERPGPGHDYREARGREATCTESGFASYVCSRCGDSYTQEKPALGHSWGAWKQTKAPTCQQDGVEERVCSRCGSSETRSVSGGSHSYGDWHVAEPGTCVTLEMRIRTCVNCGHQDYQYWGYGSHDWGEWETTREATPTQKGERRRVCKNNPAHTETMEYSYDVSAPDAPELIPEPAVLPDKPSPDDLSGQPADPKSGEGSDAWIRLEASYSGGPFKAGDTFTATLRLTNGPKPVTLSGYYAVLGKNENDSSKPLPGKLAPNEEYFWFQTMFVTEDDFVDGAYVLNRYWGLEYTDETGESLVGTAELHAPLYDESLYTHLTLTVARTGEAKEYYVEGDHVTYDVTLRNDSNVKLTGCAVYFDNELAVNFEDCGELEPGGEKTLNYVVPIYQAYCDVGHATFSWYGMGYLAGYEAQEHPSSETQGTVWSETLSDQVQAAIAAQLIDPEEFYLLDLNVDWPGGPMVLQPDDNAELKLTVTNHSDQTLKDVYIDEIWDCGDAYRCTIGDLAPEETCTVTDNAGMSYDYWNYAKEHDGNIYAHWQAFGYTPDQVEITSQKCEERFVIVHEEPGEYVLSLTVERTDGGKPLHPQEQCGFKLTVTNHSEETLHDVYTYEAWASGELYIFTIKNLGPGESQVLLNSPVFTAADWNYANNNGGVLPVTWDAYAYTADDQEIKSNVCSLDIEAAQDEKSFPAMAIVSVSPESGAGKKAGDWLSCALTVKNTGNTETVFQSLEVYDAIVSGGEYDFSGFSGRAGNAFAPGEGFTETVLIKVTDDDLAYGQMERGFAAWYACQNVPHLTDRVDIQVPLDGKPANNDQQTLPELGLSVVCLDADPFAFDETGHTGDITYQAVVSLLAAPETVSSEMKLEPITVDTIVIATAAGSVSMPVGPYTLYPNESTPNIPLLHNFAESEKGGDGLLHISFTAVGRTKTLMAYNSNQVDMAHEALAVPPWEVPAETDVVVDKYEISVPKSPNGYALGEEVQYAIWVCNISDVVIPSLDIHDPLAGSDVICTLHDLEVECWYEFKYSHYVTQEEVMSKRIDNTAFVTWTDPNTGANLTRESNTVTVYTTQEDALHDVEISVAYMNPPANGQYYVEGEVFPIRVDWANHSNETLTSVYVFDYRANKIGIAPEGTYLVSNGVMAPGETGMFVYNYQVTEADVLIFAFLRDSAYIGGYDQYGGLHYAEDEVIALAEEDPADPGQLIPGLKVEKTETSHPANGEYYQEGETITYEITITNTGTAELTDVTIGDSLSDTFMGGFASITILHPTESHKYAFSYKVTSADVAAGKVVNYGLGYYTFGSMIDVPVVSDPVVSLTGKPVPGPVPGPGGHPADPGAPTGHIGVPIVADAKEDACAMTLVSRGDGRAEYELHLCAKHAALKASSPAMDQWKAEIDELYQQILKAAAGSARDTVMAERAAFYAYVDSWKALLEAQNYRDPAAADESVAEMLMQQCAEMCYLIHHAPETRADSLITGSYGGISGSGAAAAKCVIQTAEPAQNTIRYLEVLCGEHAELDSLTLSLLRNAKTRAGVAEAFISARRQWQCRLNNQVTEQYKTADQTRRNAISSCRKLLDELLSQREALYQYLYPDNPEIVAEVMARMVMLDVIRRCSH